MAKLILMRHGTAKNIPDPPLSEIGLTEVHMASDKVSKWDVTHFFSSPSRRCVSTAKVLSRAKAEIKTDARLDDGSSWEKVRPLIDEIKRIDGTAVVVTHAPVIKSVLVQLLGIPPEKIDLSKISPLSYSVIELDGSAPFADKLLTDMFYESSKIFT